MDVVIVFYIVLCLLLYLVVSMNDTLGIVQEHGVAKVWLVGDLLLAALFLGAVYAFPAILRW